MSVPCQIETDDGQADREIDQTGDLTYTSVLVVRAPLLYVAPICVDFLAISWRIPNSLIETCYCNDTGFNKENFIVSFHASCFIEVLLILSLSVL